MVSKCANPSCETSFRYFRRGRLFVFEPRDKSLSNPVPTVEHFWLCEGCARGMTIALDQDGFARVESMDCNRPDA
jgi:hypothetical protein